MRTNDVKALRNPQSLPPQFDLLKRLLQDSVQARARVGAAMREYMDVRGKAMRDIGCSAADFDRIVNTEFNKRTKQT